MNCSPAWTSSVSGLTRASPCKATGSGARRGRASRSRLRLMRGADLGPRTSTIEVFTPRIDTIYGANFIVLAPEHPIVREFADESPDPDAFRAKVAKFTGQDRSARMTGDVEKEGFDTGRRAINPFTGHPVPIWVANFVLVEYGT